MTESNLFKLLNFNPSSIFDSNDEEGRQKIDGDAIIKEARENPRDVDLMYSFTRFTKGRAFHVRWSPLHEAIFLRLGDEVIDALLSPIAIRQKIYGVTPLHLACTYGSSLNVVNALLCNYPDAAKEKNRGGWTPLHKACQKGASLDVICALVNSWPNAANEKDDKGRVPLYFACRHGASLAVVQLLFDLWLEAVENRNIHSVKSLFSKSNPVDVNHLLFYIWSLFYENQSDKSFRAAMRFFIRVNWWNGAFFLINMYPTVTNSLNLHTNVMADYLSAVGKCCSLTTMSMVIQNEPDLLEGVK